MSHRWFLVGTVFILLFFPALVVAQSDNVNVSGVVQDPSGAGVPQAKVTLKNQQTGLLREAATNESGFYSIPTIPPGYYTLSAEASGFKKFESRDNKVDAGVPANISATLTVGALTETVEVQATTTPLQTESGALGRVVEGRQLQDIQLNGRNPIYLALTKPGVRGSSLSSFSYGMTTAGLSINGSRTQDNVITYDGAVAVRTRSNGTSIGAADLDNTAEVQILTAAYGAEYGRAAGGQIRIVTKSGTRDLHGSLYEYFRNDKLDANSWTNNKTGTAISPLRFNQFGYNVTGPVFIPGKFNTSRDKLFFTWSQEFVRYRTVSTGLRTVPSAKMKTGDFSELLSSNIWYSTATTIKDPTTGLAFPGNIIPASRLSSNGTALLSVYPGANLSTPIGNSNWYGVASSPTDQRKDSIGLDWLPTSKDNVRFRGMLYHYYSESPLASNFLLSSQTWNRPNQTASVTWTHTFSPTFIMEAMGTASRDQVYIGMQDTTAFNRTTYGINYPYLYGSGSKDRPNKLPAVEINGFSSYTGTPYPSQSTGPIYSGSANFTKILTTHTVKFGALLERAGQNDYDQINVNGVPGGTNNQNGRFVFQNSTSGGTGLAIANAALGVFDTYAEIGARSYTPYRGHMFESFVQDEWKATPKLKIIYGVRWTVVQPYYSLWNNMTVFDPAYYSTANAVSVNPTTGAPIVGTGDKYNGITLLGSGWPEAALGRVSIAGDSSYDYLFRGASRSYSNIDWAAFQPRFGVAYQLGSKSVLRAGGGRYLTRLGVSDSVFLGGNPPLQPMGSVSGGTVDNPGGGTSASFPLSVTTQSKDFPMPESWNWTFTMERQLPFDTVLGVSYVGRRGLHGQRERNINQLAIGTLTDSANAGLNVDYLRPYKGYGAIRMTENTVNSRYNALQVELNRRFNRGLSFGVSYTLSRCSDDGSDQRDVLPDAYDASYLWGPCTYDATHVLVTNWVWELPWLQRAENRMVRNTLGGWRITGTAQFETGTPFSVWRSDDYAGVGTGSANNILYFWNYANYGQGATYANQFTNSGDTTSTYLVVKDANGNSLFTKPASGTIVKDELRGYFRNPGFQNWNIGLTKEVTFGEKVPQKVLFRAEAFNWLNHPNWGSVNNDPASSSFGQVTTKSGNRNLQLSLRYSF